MDTGDPQLMTTDSVQRKSLLKKPNESTSTLVKVNPSESLRHTLQQRLAGLLGDSVRLQCPVRAAKPQLSVPHGRHRRLADIPYQEADDHVATPCVRRISVHQGGRHT